MHNNLPLIRRAAKRFPLLIILASAILLLTSFSIIFSSQFSTEGFNELRTGSKALALHEASAVKRDILINAVAALMGVLIIFLFFFRSLKGLLYVMTPVVFAVISILGLAILLIGSLPEMTGAFAGLIFGLGLDLGMALYVRYLINIEIYADPIERMDRSLGATDRSITTGVITTALTFLPMVLSSFRNIRVLGLLTVLGILTCRLFLFSLASLAIKPSSGRYIEIPSLRIIAEYAYRKPVFIVFLAFILTLSLAFFIPHIQFNGDITIAGSDDRNSGRTIEKLKDTFNKVQNSFIAARSGERKPALKGSVEINETLAGDIAVIGLLGLTLTNIILYIDFRKVYLVLLCQAPAAISILCTLGFMGMTGRSLYVMNTLVLLLLFGIGTDYALHLLHQYQADRDIGATFLQSGKAVLAAGLTTLAGFGPAGFSSHPGLAATGQLAALGITLCVVLSLTLVPALLSLHEGTKPAMNTKIL